MPDYQLSSILISSYLVSVDNPCNIYPSSPHYSTSIIINY